MVFTVTRTDSVNYITINYMEKIIMHITRTINLYQTRGFVITDIFADNEFNMVDLNDAVSSANLHICAAGEHVPKIERPIRIIKERTRTICHSLPYKKLPRIMTKSIATTSNFWMNAFPTSGGISGNYSPSNIIDNKSNPDCNKNRIPFGAYALAYDKTNSTTKKIAIPCVALNESNDSDGQYSMSLESGKS